LEIKIWVWVTEAKVIAVLEWKKEDKDWSGSIDWSIKEEVRWNGGVEWKPERSNKVHWDVKNRNKIKDQASIKENLNGKTYKLLARCS